MRVYSLLLTLFLCLGLLGCKEKEDHSFIYTSLIVNYFLPSEEIRKQCAQPNAIYWGTINAGFISGGCISTKVQSGLIYDVDTNQNITSDTLVSGKRFKCLCNGKVVNDGFRWRRSKFLFDSIPQPSPEMELIKSYNPYTYSEDDKDKDYLLTTSAYKANDNLFCITICNIDSNTYQYQYQFLKIRSPQ